MRTFLGMLPLFALMALSIRAADEAKVTALKAADDERCAAIVAADKARMEAIFSDELRYAHSNGKVDTKASYIESIVTKKTKYLSFNYEERNFTFPVPGLALMNARLQIKSTGEAGDMDYKYSILAAFREEQGKWRFIAWQSCRLTPPAAK